QLIRFILPFVNLIHLFPIPSNRISSSPLPIPTPYSTPPKPPTLAIPILLRLYLSHLAHLPLPIPTHPRHQPLLSRFRLLLRNPPILLRLLLSSSSTRSSLQLPHPQTMELGSR